MKRLPKLGNVTKICLFCRYTMYDVPTRRIYCSDACRSAMYRLRNVAENEGNCNAISENWHIHDGFRVDLIRVRDIGILCAVCGLQATEELMLYMNTIRIQHTEYKATHPYRMSKWAESAVTKYRE